jgi:hypothetical protein
VPVKEGDTLLSISTLIKSSRRAEATHSMIIALLVVLLVIERVGSGRLRSAPKKVSLRGLVYSVRTFFALLLAPAACGMLMAFDRVECEGSCIVQRLLISGTLLAKAGLVEPDGSPRKYYIRLLEGPAPERMLVKYTSRRPPDVVVAAQRGFCVREGLAVASDQGPDGVSIVCVPPGCPFTTGIADGVAYLWLAAKPTGTGSTVTAEQLDFGKFDCR